MKIAYLLQSDRDYDEIVETLNQLVKQNDHAFVMINNDDLRDKVSFTFADHPRVHISRTQEFAQEGDLSLARGTIIQIKDSLQHDHFDYYINLTDGMIPIKKREDIVKFLEKDPTKDYYYVAHQETPELKKKADKYYTFTNVIAFPKSRFIRGMTKASASFFAKFGFKRHLSEPYQIGSPWFMLTGKTGETLAEHFDYVSNTFKLSWYPEEMYIPMMMDKFVYIDGRQDDHINQDYRVVGPDGTWKESSGAKPLTEDVLQAHPEALFGGMITAEDNMELYQNYFDKYNETILLEEEKKEKTFIDPELLLRSMKNAKNNHNDNESV